MQFARPVFAGLAWLFLGLIVVQVFFAGLGLFTGEGFGLHREFGYFVSGVPLLVLVAALVARAGRRTVLLAALLFVVTFVQTILPILQSDLPLVAALHPPTALLIFWLALLVGRRATARARSTEPVAVEPAEAPATVT